MEHVLYVHCGTWYLVPCRPLLLFRVAAEQGWTLQGPGTGCADRQGHDLGRALTGTRGHSFSTVPIERRRVDSSSVDRGARGLIRTVCIL